MYKPGWSRRYFLKSTSLAGGYLASMSAIGQTLNLDKSQPSTSKIKSTIGYWKKDSSGLPVFRYIAKPLKRSNVTNFTQPAELLEDDPYFLLGNYRLTGFIHSSGVLRLMSGERAWARLNEHQDGHVAHYASLNVSSKDGDSAFNLIGPQGMARDPILCRREFGIGYATFFYALKNLRCRRTLSVMPSTQLNSGLSVFLVEIELINQGSTTIDIRYEESLLARYASNMDRVKPEENWPVEYQATVEKQEAIDRITCRFKAVPKDPTRIIPQNQASRNDLSPKAVFIQSLGELNQNINGGVFSTDRDTSGKNLGINFIANIEAGKGIKIYFVIGTSDAVAINLTPIVNAVSANKDKNAASPFIDQWKNRLPSFAKEKNSDLLSEMQWNAYVLESMAKHSEFYNETFIPQGMTYDYTIGLTAAPRDHLQHSLPLCYTNPALAKSTIRFVLKKMTHEGEIKYTDIGYGRTTNSAWNTSDQQLYLFLAVSEYLRISEDSGFLEETTEFLPMEANYSATTLEKLRRALAYLRDEVNVGPNGLIRLMNSDWNDMIYMDTPIMKNFWLAESHMNSAMALCVIPALILELEKNQKKLTSKNQSLCKDLISGLRILEKSNRDAFYKDLDNRSFSRRLYLASGEALGDKDMHIEPQGFLMQDLQFPKERKKILWHEIENRLLDKELLEPRQRERGIPGSQYMPGTGENGGSWHALTGPLVIGLASVDKNAAAKLLERMTFKHFAKCYPDYWVGHWTSPDTINTFEAGNLVGLPRNGDIGFWFNFAAYCAHSHAWPLYCYLRLQKNDIATS